MAFGKGTFGKGTFGGPTVVSVGTYLYKGASNRAGVYKGAKSPDSQFYKGTLTGVFSS